MTLDQAPRGVPLVLLRPDLPLPRARRLAELGLRPGAVVTVVRRTVGGGRIVGVADARVALGRDTLRRMTVRHREEPLAGGAA